MFVLIARDKLLHAAVGSAIAAGPALLGYPAAGAALAAIAGGVKEWRDKRNPARYTFDGWDAWATALPGAIVAAGWELARVLIE